MEIILVIGGVVLIVVAVLVWHNYGPRIAVSVKGGPIVPDTNLSGIVDKMQAATREALGHAATLEKALVKVRTDLASAQSKLVPAEPTTPKV